MIEFLRAGGPVMIPLLGCSVLALAIIVERLINLRESKTLPVDEVDHLKTLVEVGSKPEYWRTEVDWDWRLPEEISGTIDKLPLMKKWLLKTRGPVVTDDPSKK